MFRDEDIDEQEIHWGLMLEAYDPLPAVLVGMIVGYICLDKRLKGFPVGCG